MFYHRASNQFTSLLVFHLPPLLDVLSSRFKSLHFTPHFSLTTTFRRFIIALQITSLHSQFFTSTTFRRFFIALQITSLHSTSLHFTSLHFTPHHFTSLIVISLTHYLQIRDLERKAPLASAGSFFHSLIALFAKECFPMYIICFLALTSMLFLLSSNQLTSG